MVSIAAAWRNNPWYKGIFLVVIAALVAAYYFLVYRKDTTQPDAEADSASWKKADSDPTKIKVEKPLTDKEINDELQKVNRELAARK